MIARRLIETLAMTIIGDSLLCVISPRRHVSLWASGPKWWQRAATPFVRRPGLTRALGTVGVAFGVWLASRQQPPVPITRRLGRSTLRRKLAAAVD